MKNSLPFAIAAMALLPLLGSAQIERLTANQKSSQVKRLDALSLTGEIASHVNKVKKGGDQDKKVLVSRVAADLKDAKGLFGWYNVPAMSDVQRLPDHYPIDGVAMAPVSIILAQGEYEPGSFLVYPFKDLGKVEFKLTPLRSAEGKVYPQDQLDLKVIKVWYQNKNGWYSYFGDTGFKLCPELLLNDEDLIRVDTEKGANYARLTEKDGTISEKWLNPPRELNKRYWEHYRRYNAFAPMKENFRDAKTLQPVTLEEGSFKNFFLTANTTKAVAPGLYKGAIKLSKDKSEIGEIPVAIRVLPFELPDPKAYLDVDKDFLVASYNYISFELIMDENGGDIDLARKQLEAVLRNQAEHNQVMHMIRGSANTEWRYTVETMKKVGMRTDVLIAGFGPQVQSKKGMEAHAQRVAAFQDKVLGHHNNYLGHGDEPGSRWIVENRPVFEAYQKYGFKFFIAGGDSLIYKAGYIYDWLNFAKDPVDGKSATKFREIGDAHSAWYACMHVGPENPAFNRRQNGMAPYLSGYSALCNYAHHFGPYNDDTTTYRPMVFAYGSYDGVIDTIQWEGFREGIDDIRYATCMKKLALEAEKSDDIKIHYLGKKAKQYLTNLDGASADLNACRLEMISYILQLREALSK